MKTAIQYGIRSQGESVYRTTFDEVEARMSLYPGDILVSREVTFGEWEEV